MQLSLFIEGAGKLNLCVRHTLRTDVALATAGAGIAAQTTCWTFFTTHFARYQSKDMGASIMDAVVQGACAHFASTETATEVAAFFVR